MPKRQPDLQPASDALSQSVRDTLMRLFSVVSANGLILPNEMLFEIEAISKLGADPEWQVKRLTELLDRWATLQ